MRMLDLFSGLGGASEAMVKAGWTVHRLENNLLLSDVANTKICDVMTWPFQDIPKGYYDLIWASPPCVAFSDGYSSPKSIAKREGVEYKPDMSLVAKAKEIIDYLEPQYWVIENVRGAQPFFQEMLGKRSMVTGSIYLWGNFPALNLGRWKMGKKEDDWSTNPLRANIRAKIPYEISNALKLAVEQQATLDWWS